MNDRELLEKAGRAARQERSAAGDLWSNARGELWNPLVDDGDAMRLACALKINIEHAETLSRKAHGVNCWPVGRGDCGHMENDLTDYNAATRRAIVCAAAAMVERPVLGAA